MSFGIGLTIAFFAWLWYRSSQDEHKQDLRSEKRRILEEMYHLLEVDQYRQSILKRAQDAVYPIPVAAYLTTKELLHYRIYENEHESVYDFGTDEVVQKVAELVKARRYRKVAFFVKTVEDDDY